MYLHTLTSIIITNHRHHRVKATRKIISLFMKWGEKCEEIFARERSFPPFFHGWFEWYGKSFNFYKHQLEKIWKTICNNNFLKNIKFHGILKVFRQKKNRKSWHTKKFKKKMKNIIIPVCMWNILKNIKFLDILRNFQIIIFWRIKNHLSMPWTYIFRRK